MKIKNLLQYLPQAGMVALVLISGSSLAQAAASGKNTAAYLKANIDKLEGKKVSLDVAFVRSTAEELPEYDFLFAVTGDSDERSGGGGVLVVIDADDREKVLRKYGTNIDKEGNDRKRKVKFETMRGVASKMVVGSGEDADLQRASGIPRHFVYLDLTENGADVGPALVKALKKTAITGKRFKR